MYGILRVASYGQRELLLFGGGLLVLAGIAFFTVPWLAPVPLVGIAAVMGFFRDPKRVAPDGEGLVISPADGKIADIENVDESEFLECPAVRVGIFLSVFDVHINRSPLQGVVEYVKHRPGKFRSAFTAHSTRDNESNALGMRTPEGMPVLVRQLTGAIARRIVCAVEPGESLERGERYGMIKFGSRTEVFLPADRVRELKVSIGDRVRGGETVLGELHT